jgi:hypothetical protein
MNPWSTASAGDRAAADGAEGAGAAEGVSAEEAGAEEAGAEEAEDGGGVGDGDSAVRRPRERDMPGHYRDPG